MSCEELYVVNNNYFLGGTFVPSLTLCREIILVTTILKYHFQFMFKFNSQADHFIILIRFHYGCYLYQMSTEYTPPPSAVLFIMCAISKCPYLAF